MLGSGTKLQSSNPSVDNFGPTVWTVNLEFNAHVNMQIEHILSTGEWLDLVSVKQNHESSPWIPQWPWVFAWFNHLPGHTPSPSWLFSSVRKWRGQSTKGTQAKEMAFSMKHRSRAKLGMSVTSTEVLSLPGRPVRRGWSGARRQAARRGAEWMDAHTLEPSTWIRRVCRWQFHGWMGTTKKKLSPKCRLE